MTDNILYLDEQGYPCDDCSVCFRDCSIVPIAEKSCITA